VLCEDPSVLKIFGLCKTSPSRKRQAKTPRHKSDGTIKRIRTEEGEDAPKRHTVRPSKHQIISSDVEPRERNLMRSCRDRGIKKTELHQSESVDDLATRPDRGTDDTRQHSKIKEQRPRNEHHKPREHEQKKSRSSEKDDKTSGFSPVLTSEYSKKGNRSLKTFAGGDGLRHALREEDLDGKGLKKAKRSLEANAGDGRQRRTFEQDVDHRVEKRRRSRDDRSTDRSPSAGFDFLPSTKGRSLSPAASTSLLGETSGVDRRSTPKSASITPSKSLTDEPLFDNSDDEFPDLVIDVPTI